MIKIHCLIFISCCILNILAVPSSVCRADFRWDDCGKPPKAVIYYWNQGSRCEMGMWKGCLPNPNMFADEYECINTCVFIERPATRTGPSQFPSLDPEEIRNTPPIHTPPIHTSPINEKAGYSAAYEGGKATDDQKFAGSALYQKYKYIPEANIWLRLHIVPQTWECAVRQCQLEGGELASPSSQVLTNALVAMIEDYNVIRHSVFIARVLRREVIQTTS